MKKILTIIFDGFGYREEEKGNAIKAAKMTTFEELYKNYPHALLSASEQSVGLNEGQVGNSEVGHMTIGAGRLLKSNEKIVDEFFESGINSENLAISKLLAHKEKRIHIIGLCSDGNIHAGIDDFISMFTFLKNNEFKNVYFHLITDGRDTNVDVSIKYINQIQDKIKEYGIGQIATVCGRYYAMDRDENYDRTKKYYDLVTKGIGIEVLNLESAINASYAKGITDEFIKPIVYNRSGLLKNGDTVIWMNYRADRIKQILSSFLDSKFDGFITRDYSELEIFTLFPIDKIKGTNVFIKTNECENSLGIYLSKLGLKQARVAESEKFPHVTYFFDGGNNDKIEKCDKFHVLSPKVATYDLKPEMSAVDVTKKTIECMEKDYDFILTNFANPDMVGHTGNMEATTKACISLDMCLKYLVEAAENNFYTIFLLSDHGNSDTMINPDGSICTTHTLAKVPFIILDNKVELKKAGDLTNVAPTILDYMNISIPEQMTSDSLLEEK